MPANHTSYVLDLKGNLDNRAREYSRALQRFSRTGRRSLGRLGRAAHHVGRGIDALGNRYAGLLTGGAAFATGRYLTNLDERFTRLGITAEISAAQVDKLKQRIFEVAQMPNIRVDPGQLTSAVESIVEKTGDLEFAQNNLRNIGLAMQATGALGQPIGDIMAEFQKMGVENPDKILKMLDLLNVQGKEGAFTLENLAKLGPRVVTAYTAVTNGARGPVKTIREMGAALQIIRMGTGSAEQAATAFEAVIRELTNPKKIKQLKELGIQIFDPEALKRGEEVLRPINQLLLEIQKKSEGKRTVLGQIFGEEAIRAFNAINAEDMARFYNVQATGAQTIEDAARAADTMSAAITSLMTALKKFASANLADDIEALADAINSIDPDTLEKILKVASGAAIAGAGLFAGRKLFQGGRAIGGLFSRAGGRRGSGASGAGGAVGGVLPGGVQKVYVVNMGDGLGGSSRRRRGGGSKLMTVGAVAAAAYASREGALMIDSALRNVPGYENFSKKTDMAAYSGLRNTLDFVGLKDWTNSVWNVMTIGHNAESVQRAVDAQEQAAQTQQEAADTMAQAADSINQSADNISMASEELRESRRPANGYTPWRIDPYSGPMTAGGD